MKLRVFAAISRLFKVNTLAKCVLTVLGLNWNQRFRDKKTKLNICLHMITSSSQRQNRSFNVMERTRTSEKCSKMKNACAKRAKLLFFIIKYANLLLKLSNLDSRLGHLIGSFSNDDDKEKVT